MEPWDGPACAVFTDGVRVGAVLDRNGLRPARWTLTRRGRLVLASEDGVLDLSPSEVSRRGRLGPGQQLLVDPARGRLLLDDEIKGALANRRPYRRWLTAHRLRLGGVPPEAAEGPPRPTAAVRRDQLVFGWTREDERMVLAPMAATGKEAVGAMGDDTPLAVLSHGPEIFFDYFNQRFAQVTNPPIDPYRERAVMSLRVSLGAEVNLFEETPEHCRQLELDAPVLTPEALARLEAVDHPAVSVARLDTTFAAPDVRDLPDVPDEAWRARAAEALERGLDRLCAEAEAAVRTGSAILLLTDRAHGPTRPPIPAALAVAAVQSHLRRVELRARAGLIVETGEVRETHHVAVLIGLGAGAVVPWLALEAVDLLPGTEGSGGPARARLLGALHRGLLTIFSKMGISTLESYRGAQLFEILGLDRAFVDRWFHGMRSDLGGADLGIVACEALLRHRDAWEGDRLPTGGRYQWRRDGAPHAWNPVSIGTLQHAVRAGRFDLFERYAAEVDRHGVARHTLRSLLRVRPGRGAIPLDEVEPVARIVRRFRTGAMSFGSISREAHETLAIAMNRLGGRSNSGEGGEDPVRDRPRAGLDRRSAIRQVASGRFGVTPSYLLAADELQIKMAQGAKPGEGGQLPGHKVDATIAAVRHSTPGVTLISPPPHHDIYSIEDLYQLIHDLKQANARATVSVKLVAQGGIGAVAAGVVKAGADGILISGRSGGTGASPLSSIRHTGLPWEMGLAEVRQALIEQGLRERVTLEVDGHLKTGRDVLIAALLGAERFGFGTAALVASGCVLMRVCHKNTCPVGIATQDPALRALFPGEPEHVIRFMEFVGRQVREQLAALGFRTLDEVVGRADLLEVDIPESCWKAAGLDLRPLLAQPPQARPGLRYQGDGSPRVMPGGWLVEQLQRSATPALVSGEPVSISLPLFNTDRSVGTRLSSVLVERHPEGLPEGTIRVDLHGTAGQSLGAFLAPGIDLTVHGGANDGVGKGMAGGVISVRGPDGSEDGPVLGNVALYGATGGRLFVRGSAGERFAVRNSGAKAVVEGLGDHGCEYMTGGEVVVLGRTGRNFGAGMSGGVAYVLDRDGFFRTRVHRADVRLHALDIDDEAAVMALLEEHHRRTGSPSARRILGHWQGWRELFAKVLPAVGGGSITAVAARGQGADEAREVG
jgi:glutamate synthase domain-containing protein 2/glutamate synthase domain-containing protein 3